MRIIKIAREEKVSGMFDFLKKPYRTKEDILVDHFNNYVKPRVIAEFKRVKDADDFSDNSSHYRYLISSIRKGLRSMLEKYDHVNARRPDRVQREKVEKILLEDSERSLGEYSSGLEPFLNRLLKAKSDYESDSNHQMEYLIAMETYGKALGRLSILLLEYAENYFSLLGRTDVLKKR